MDINPANQRTAIPGNRHRSTPAGVFLSDRSIIFGFELISASEESGADPDNNVPTSYNKQVTPPSLRPAVRALIINTLDQLLMAKLEFPNWTGWVLPGGGVEPDEDHRQALTRELAEETGIPELFMGPPVFRRQQLIPGLGNGFDGQEETVYLVPCHQFEVNPGLPMEQLRDEGLVELRWWTGAELVETTEKVVPPNLAEILTQVLEFGAPASPMILEEIDEG